MVATRAASINGQGCPSTVAKRCGTLPLKGMRNVEHTSGEHPVCGRVGKATDEERRTRVDSAAIVTYGDHEWVLRDGDSLSFGRQSTCEVRVGAPDAPGPEDLGVSRRAGTLTCAQGSIWVRNDSTTQALYVHCSGRGEMILEARGDMFALAEPHFDVVVRGRVLTYRISIDLQDANSSTVVDDDAPSTSPPTVVTLQLSDRERRYLAAVCEPLLSRIGTNPRPASYAEAAARLGLARSTVRNNLDELRRRLLDAGVPGMDSPDAKDVLARYAVRTHTITDADLKLLDQCPADGDEG
jgi:hypothetical protein